MPVPYNSRAPPTFSSSTESKSKIVIEKRDESSDAASQNATAKADSSSVLVNSFSATTIGSAVVNAATSVVTAAVGATAIKTSVISSTSNCIPATTAAATAVNKSVSSITTSVVVSEQKANQVSYLLSIFIFIYHLLKILKFFVIIIC